VQLEVGGLRRGVQIGRMTELITGQFTLRRPGAVIVQGDTNSALAGALAANAEEIPLLHVEAGLRSHDRAMPEEHNRVLIDHLADLCAAPTTRAAEHLAAEGIPPSRIVVTGNTVIEAVQRMVPHAGRRAELRQTFGLAGERYVIATIHRPENVDHEPSLRSVLQGLTGLDVPVLFPMHPRTATRVRDFGLSGLLAPLTVVPPLRPGDFLGLAQEASVIVSDSGGIQEEASVLKRPVLVVRRSTERPEGIGTFAEMIAPAEIAERGRRHLTGHGTADLARIPSPYGDGTASHQIARLASRLASGMTFQERGAPV
jgi:UDP-N-acetylglucosamine 2-epimerase (non-hydrolysing)